MTALKPLEDLRARGVASRRYPLNEICAHPECSEPTVDPHHIFPRSQIGNDSWFVILGDDLTETSEEKGGGYRSAIPHVTGLCRAHHDAVEIHDAWIKLEDGEWRWYDRKSTFEDERDGVPHSWELLGPLNPQPGSKTGKPKRKKFKGEARRRRTTISIKVPQDEQEDGAGIWDDRLEQVRERMAADGDLDPDRPPYYLLTDVMYSWATRPKGDD